MDGETLDQNLLRIREVLSDVTKRGSVRLPSGGDKKITGAVAVDEGCWLAETICRNGFRTTLETGVACGVSTLAICSALETAAGNGAVHFGVDPCQQVDHGGAALALLAEFGLSRRFCLLEGPMHIVGAELVREQQSLDFAFIDGWHTFDYALVDFFLVDKLLRPGGIVAFHDATMPAVKKVIEFLKRNRRYTLEKYQRTSWLRSAYRTVKCVARRDPYVLYPIRRMPNLLFLRKEQSWEPPWNYFRNF